MSNEIIKQLTSNKNTIYDVLDILKHNNIDIYYSSEKFDTPTLIILHDLLMNKKSHFYNEKDLIDKNNSLDIPYSILILLTTNSFSKILLDKFKDYLEEETDPDKSFLNFNKQREILLSYMVNFKELNNIYNKNVSFLLSVKTINFLYEFNSDNLSNDNLKDFNLLKIKDFENLLLNFKNKNYLDNRAIKLLKPHIINTFSNYNQSKTSYYKNEELQHIFSLLCLCLSKIKYTTEEEKMLTQCVEKITKENFNLKDNFSKSFSENLKNIKKDHKKIFTMIEKKLILLKLNNENNHDIVIKNKRL